MIYQRKNIGKHFFEKGELDNLIEMFIEYDHQMALCPNMSKHGEKKLE
jgi:hypothetical protein